MSVNAPKTTYPPEPKVIAATAASGGVGFFATLLSTLAQDQHSGIVFPGLPEFLEPFVNGLILAGATFAAGWLAKHQHRRGLDAVEPKVSE